MAKHITIDVDRSRAVEMPNLSIMTLQLQRYTDKNAFRKFSCPHHRSSAYHTSPRSPRHCFSSCMIFTSADARSCAGAQKISTCKLCNLCVDTSWFFARGIKTNHSEAWPSMTRRAHTLRRQIQRSTALHNDRIFGDPSLELCRRTTRWGTRKMPHARIPVHFRHTSQRLSKTTGRNRK